jgi:phospholipase C
MFEHLVVLMLGNRSFGNIVGFFTTETTNRKFDNPAITAFYGLVLNPVATAPATESYWNPSNASYFANAPSAPDPVKTVNGSFNAGSRAR